MVISTAGRPEACLDGPQFAEMLSTSTFITFAASIFEVLSPLFFFGHNFQDHLLDVCFELFVVVDGGVAEPVRTRGVGGH